MSWNSIVDLFYASLLFRWLVIFVPMLCWLALSVLAFLISPAIWAIYISSTFGVGVLGLVAFWVAEDFD